MLFFILAAVYLSISLVLYFSARSYCKRGGVFRMPAPSVFLFLSLTWGAFATFVGLFPALFLTLARRRRGRYRLCRVFYLKKARFAFSLGLFLFAPENDRRVLEHEFGHSIQNLFFGPFMPAVVMIPSFLRFTFRAAATRLGKRPASSYDAAWFEGSATASGRESLSSF